MRTYGVTAIHATNHALVDIDGVRMRVPCSSPIARHRKYDVHVTGRFVILQPKNDDEQGAALPCVK